MSVRILNKDEIDAFNANASHILQTTYWGDFLKSLNRKVEYLIDGKSGFVVSFNKIPFTKKKIAYLQRSKKPTKDIIKYIYTNYPDTLYIKIEPLLENISSNHEYLLSLGLKKSSWNIFLPSTMYIDLKKDVNIIFSDFDQNTKRNVKKAEKLGVIVEERMDEDAIKIFVNLTNETTKRQKFFTHNNFYYEQMWKQMILDKKAVMLLAKYKEEYIGALIIFYHNDRMYYPYGASVNNNTGAMSLLHFEAIKRAKGIINSALNNNNLTLYDLWGTLSQEDEEKKDFQLNRMYGVHRFKKGLGGSIYTNVGSYDYILNPFSYYTFDLLVTLRRKYFEYIKKNKKRNGIK